MEVIICTLVVQSTEAAPAKCVGGEGQQHFSCPAVPLGAALVVKDEAMLGWKSPAHIWPDVSRGLLMLLLVPSQQ